MIFIFTQLRQFVDISLLKWSNLHFYQQIYRLTDPAQLENIVCNPLSFNKTFTFPSGIAISAIQQSFCSAVTNHSSSLQELLDMFNTGDMLLEVCPADLLFKKISFVVSIA